MGLSGRTGLWPAARSGRTSGALQKRHDETQVQAHA